MLIRWLELHTQNVQLRSPLKMLETWQCGLEIRYDHDCDLALVQSKHTSQWFGKVVGGRKSQKAIGSNSRRCVVGFIPNRCPPTMCHHTAGRGCVNFIIWGGIHAATNLQNTLGEIIVCQLTSHLSRLEGFVTEWHNQVFYNRDNFIPILKPATW